MTSIKTALASQASSINLYKNLSTKVMKRCVNIYFNRQCPIKKLIPNYAKIKIPCISPEKETIQRKVQTVRLKEEMKFLYTNKEKVNNELYRIHLKAAQVCNNKF